MQAGSWIFPRCEAEVGPVRGGEASVAPAFYDFLAREKKSAIEPKPEPDDAELRA